MFKRKEKEEQMTTFRTWDWQRDFIFSDKIQSIKVNNDNLDLIKIEYFVFYDETLRMKMQAADRGHVRQDDYQPELWGEP